MITQIVSGGQTGVDRAALDVALQFNIAHGGWCPNGRRAEDGMIPDRYDGLKETPSAEYEERTQWNIRDSNGTLIIIPEDPLPDNIKDGTLLTIAEVNKQNKPHRIVDVSKGLGNIPVVTEWVKDENIRIINIAGPRESSYPGIYVSTKTFLAGLTGSFDLPLA